jgi:hypothetical protein
LIRKNLGDDELTELTDLDLTPKNKHTKLRRSYAIADITALVSDSDAAESEHEPVTHDEYEPLHQPEPESVADEILSDDEPTPKKKQKIIKVPVREAINANRKEHEPSKAENKVSPPVIVID